MTETCISCTSKPGSDPPRGGISVTHQYQGTSYLVLALKVLEEGLVEIGGDAVEQRPQHALCEPVVVQVFHLDTHADEQTHHAVNRGNIMHMSYIQ